MLNVRALCGLLLSLLAVVYAQNSSLTPSLSLTTGSVTVTLATTTRSGAPVSFITTVLPGVVSNVTVTPTLTPTPTPPPVNSTTSATPTESPTPSPSKTPDPFVLDTRVDPAFAVLGVILILTGLPSAFWGHKNRWTSFFLIGFYTLSLTCLVLILQFGVIPAINPPTKSLRGLFVLACFVAGVLGGGIAIFFWKGARYGIGAWGGLALALWIQCFQNGGLIKTIGLRWILYIALAVIGFALSTIPKIHYHVLLVSTAFVGASSFILGVDCFTTAGLKEFYMWNLGFRDLFPKFVNNGIQFPVSQTMQIELGLTGAVALMGIAVQLRIIKVLQKKLHEIAEETKRQDEEAELRAADRLDDVDRERAEWEKDHPTNILTKHGRTDSGMVPLMKDREDSSSPMADDRSSYFGRPRHISVLSEFKVAPTSDEDLKRTSSRFNQFPGALPSMDLGTAIQEDVPTNFISKDIARDVEVSAAELEDFKKKQSLLAEIQNIRRSIDILKSETPVPSSSEHSLRPSFASKRTLSMDATSTLLPVTSPHARPPREMAPPRARVHSMELSSLARTGFADDPISRPTSVPLKDDWDSYIHERKLLQPPAGVTPPIATTTLTPRAPISPAVQEALQRRKRRESTLAAAAAAGVAPSTDSSEDVPLARIAQQQQQQQHQHQHQRQQPASGGPVTILPPRRNSAHILAPVPQMATTRTRTFEELTERHREKMRDMQAPLTQAEKEHAELEAARQRWERAKALEKEAVTRRQAEKAAALEKRKKTGEGAGAAGAGAGPASGGAGATGAGQTRRHSRSHSADKLGGKRLSTMKVEEWQRYQQEAGGESGKRGVPFPQEGRRKSRDFLS